MKKPKTILFREINGIYTDVAGESGTLCEYLLSHGIENIPLVYYEYKHDTKIQHSCER